MERLRSGLECSSSASAGHRRPAAVPARRPAAPRPPSAAAAPPKLQRGAGSASAPELHTEKFEPVAPTAAAPGPRRLRGNKLKVAIDVDEVLGRFVHSLNAFCLDEYGQEYEVSDYHVYDFAKVWRCSQDESNHKVHEFFKSDHFSAGIEPIPGAYEALGRLRDECELVVVTSRQHVIRQPTLDWIDAHFPGVFDAVHFGNHFALEGASRKKSEICAAVGARVLVDDNPGYALECAAAGIDVLLYDWDHAYPWSKTPDGPSHDRITRVRDWDEAEAVLGVLAAAHR